MQGNTRVSTSELQDIYVPMLIDVARYRHSQISFTYKSHRGAGEEFYKLGDIKNACGHFCLSVPAASFYIRR